MIRVSIPYGEYDLRHFVIYLVGVLKKITVSIPYGEYDLRHKEQSDLFINECLSFHPLRGI